MDARADRPPVPLAILALVLGLAAIALGWFAGLSGWLETRPWLVAAPVSGGALALIPALRLAQDVRCSNCDADLSWRETLARSPSCWWCRTYTAELPALAAPQSANGSRAKACHAYRLLATHAIRSPRELDTDFLAAIEEQRRAAQLRVTSRRLSEPRRIFLTYAAQLLRVPHFQPTDLTLLRDAMTAMTGWKSESLQAPAWFERVHNRALIQAANADHLRSPEEAPAGVCLAPGEAVLWVDSVRRMRPTEQVRLTAMVVSGSLGFAPGATVSAKATLERTVQLPPGQLNPIGDAYLAVTTRDVKLVGDQTLAIEYDKIIGLAAPWERICRINYRGSEEPTFIEGRSGLLMCAVISSAIRLSRQGIPHAQSAPAATSARDGRRLLEPPAH
jgi:hypothetical protein